MIGMFVFPPPQINMGLCIWLVLAIPWAQHAGGFIRNEVRAHTPFSGRTLLPWLETVLVLFWCALPSRLEPFDGIGFSTALARTSELAALLALLVFSLIVSAIDWSIFIIPNAVLYKAALLALLLLSLSASAVNDMERLLRVFQGLLGLGTIYGVLAVLWPHSVGLGDVKYAGLIGAVCAWTGWTAWVLELVLPFIVCTLYLFWRRVAHPQRRRASIAFAPFLSCGMWAAMVC